MAFEYRVSIGADTSRMVQQVNTAIKSLSINLPVSTQTASSMNTLNKVVGSTIVTYNGATKAFNEFSATEQTAINRAVKYETAVTNQATAEARKTKAVLQSQQATEKANASTKQATTATKSMGSAIDTASKSTKTLGQDFIATAGKVAKFGAITAILGLFTGAVMAAKDAIFEFDRAITDFNKVTSLGSDGVNDYTIALGELGETVARTRTEMIGSATEFVRSGFTEEQSAQLAQIANLYTNIADTMVSSGDAASFVTSQVRAFQLSAEDAIVVVDSLNSISNNFGVSSSDLATGLTKNAAVLSGLGNEMSETMALFVGAGEQMPGQMSKISNG